ncbi:hypothetical protein, partial [Pseudomonas sp. 2995-1]|uniref:hypothetical protein n=1 Tax=Pseudomonas sp. 2995-1 TaxID=1712679 RepID=UPI001C44F842
MVKLLNEFFQKNKQHKEKSTNKDQEFIAFINESQVVSDRLVAAVEEVNDAMSNLKDIADQYTREGQILKDNSYYS